MSAPAAPTLVSITTEGLKKAGYSAPAVAALTRAQDEWLEEIKNDIWEAGKRYKSLQTSSVRVLTDGEGLIPNPSDFSSDLTMTLLECAHYGVCQAGGSTITAILAADENMSSSYPVGKEIVVYLTADKTMAYSGFISDFNTTTKEATFAPAIAVSPDDTYSYMVVDSVKPIRQKHIIRLDEIYTYDDRGRPYEYYPVGDDDFGDYYLYPVPYKTTSDPWAIRHRYYAELLTVDLAGTLMATLYKRWRSLFVQGIFVKTLEDDDDKRAVEERRIYRRKLMDLVSRETYGLDLSNLQATLSEEEYF